MDDVASEGMEVSNGWCGELCMVREVMDSVLSDE